MSFTIPSSVKPVSASTARVYKTYLNRIAAFDIDSVEKILMYPEDVVTAIDFILEMEDGTEEVVKQTGRVYYSAVFYVLYGHPTLTDPENVLRLGFQKQMPSKTTSGDKWVSADSYKKSQQK